MRYQAHDNITDIRALVWDDPLRSEFIYPLISRDVFAFDVDSRQRIHD